MVLKKSHKMFMYIFGKESLFDVRKAHIGTAVPSNLLIHYNFLASRHVTSHLTFYVCADMLLQSRLIPHVNAMCYHWRV
jgi:hypothetical protein